MMIPILRAIALRKKQNKDTGLKMAWLWPFWLVFGLSDTLYNLTICEKDVICVQSSNCQHDLQESCTNCPISSCGANYLVR